MTFTITNKGLSLLEKIIAEATEHIYFASFLLQDLKLSELLIQKRKSSDVFIEVLTTPPEAAESPEGKELVAGIHATLVANRIHVIPCEWEVGQPELTTSTRAGGRIPRWFALHTKFLVTDKHALVTSADITSTFYQDRDWNVYVTHDDPGRISLLRQKYEQLKDFFSNIPSRVESDYLDTSFPDRKLIRGYPYTETEARLEDGFYLLPHDTFGRKTIEKAILQSEKFIYLAFETIYDDELTVLMLKKLMHAPSIDFRIISSPLTAYVQNPMKARARLVHLASYGARIRVIPNLKVKLLVCDRACLSGSFDLARMGMGFLRRIGKQVNALVGSTEIMDISLKKEHVDVARDQFLRLYDSAAEEYGSWFKKDAESILRSAGAARVANDAKDLLGTMIFNEGRKSSDRIKKIGLISVKIASLHNKTRPYVKTEHITQAEQLLILHEKDQLTEEAVLGIVSLLEPAQFLLELRKLKVFSE